MKIAVLIIGIVCMLSSSCGKPAATSASADEKTCEYITIRDKALYRMDTWERESGSFDACGSLDEYATDSGAGRCVMRRIAIAGIASHHLLIGPYFHRYYRELQRNRPGIRTFIILGPDHYNKSKDEIAIADCGFYFDGEMCDVRTEIVRTWKKKLGLPDDDTEFHREHSIYSHVPFVQRYFPDARIVPVVVNEHCSTIRLSRLVGMIADFLDRERDSFLLLSTDFSHHLSREETARRDAASLEVIHECRRLRTNRLTCDAYACWSVFARVLMRRKNEFVLFSHATNEMFLNRALPDITSYFFAFYVEEEP